MQNAWAFVSLQITFDQTPCHLYANAEHGLGDFDMLSLQKDLGIFREAQGNERTFIFGAAQLNATIRQLDNFKKRR